MKIFLMTDLEGVAGVLNFHDWCEPGGRYYEQARELLTNEVDAAVSGFFDGGATEIVVADGHGYGGINPRLIDPRVDLWRGWPEGYPFGLDGSFDAIGWVGQHAKAGSEYAHLAHTVSFEYLDISINGVSLGEFGLIALCASELGVRSIFAAGGLALTKEAAELVLGIETVAVKRGVTPGTGDELTAEQYSHRNSGAIHIPPSRACILIREGAMRSVQRARAEEFETIKLMPPYEKRIVLRATEDKPKATSKECHPTSVIDLLNLPAKAIAIC